MASWAGKVCIFSLQPIVLEDQCMLEQEIGWDCGCEGANLVILAVQEDAVEALLAAKANKGATAMDDMNALHFAAQNGHSSTSQMLLKSGKFQL